jgi:hypothetical protein
MVPPPPAFRAPHGSRHCCSRFRSRTLLTSVRVLLSSPPLSGVRNAHRAMVVPFQKSATLANAVILSSRTKSPADSEMMSPGGPICSSGCGGPICSSGCGGPICSSGGGAG